MKNILIIAQICISAILVVAILLQNKGADAGSIFGGGGGGDGNVYTTKRGIEKILFISTIVIAILFIGISLANIVIS
ncbi:MAG: preprotein translocase subunit SecG [Patescibacteria group bacterium]|jgi:preprotein translocase subunit SecG